MSTSIENMIDLIRDCRQHNNDRGSKFSTATISDICNHIRLPFLIEPLTKTGRCGKSSMTREKAFEQLRAFGPSSGEHYFAEAMQPSIVNIVTQKSARARWIHQLIQEGESKADAIAHVLALWIVPDQAPDLDTLSLKREYEQWLQLQNKPAK